MLSFFGRWNRQVRPNPLFSLFRLTFIEVPDFGLREWLAKYGHAVLPSLFAHQCDTFNVAKVLGIEFNVFPKCSQIPAMEIVHSAEDSNLAVSRDLAFDFGKKMLVILFGKLAAHSEGQNLPICFFM